MKLHLASGTVYLEGYQNIDLEGELASEHPELVEICKTTIDKYYKYPFRQNMYNKVADIKADVRDLLMFADETVDEILCVNLIDHFKRVEFRKTLWEWYRVLKRGGQLIIDIDDREKQAKMFLEAKTVKELEWGLRLLYCHHRTLYDTHYWGYTRKYLQWILEQTDFKVLWIRDDYIVHDMYPNFQICAEKIVL